jgi:putative ATPase
VERGGTVDLFNYEENKAGRLLADRMRPTTLAQYIGQEHIVGPGKLLRRAIESDKVGSIILYGPPGCGKTTLAHIIAHSTDGVFMRLNAVDAGVKDVRDVIDQAKSNRDLYGKKTILFLDEVHRFNTKQQDALLPSVENGTIVFIGATTENPFHHLNGALLSRSTLFQLEPLDQTHTLQALQQAIADEERGLGSLKLEVTNEALTHLAQTASGDIRRALSALELAVSTTIPNENGMIHVNLEVAEESIRQPSIRADESVQYNVLSAFHKSLRGSSDAALVWFLYAVEKLGMDPMTFLRRLIVMCSEDIGLANPQASVQAVNAMDAYHKIGWPESRYVVAQAILFAVESPKSNAVAMAIMKTLDVLNGNQAGRIEVPLHLRDAHYKGAEKLGHVGYKYPHDYPGHYVDQHYMPIGMENVVVYEASEQGTEAKIQQNQRQRRNKS